MSLPERTALLTARLYKSEPERRTVFKDDFRALACGLAKVNQCRVSFAPNCDMSTMMLIALSDEEIGSNGPAPTVIDRIEGGTKFDGKTYAPTRQCFVCRKKALKLTWTTLSLENTPRLQLLVFTCSKQCIARMQTMLV